MEDLGITQTKHFSVVSSFSKFTFYLKYSENGLKKSDKKDEICYKFIHKDSDQKILINLFHQDVSIPNRVLFIKAMKKAPFFILHLNDPRKSTNSNTYSKFKCR